MSGQGKENLKIHVRYFAVLREQSGRTAETVDTAAATPAQLYRELAQRHGFSLAENLLRVSINDRFADLHGALHTGDQVVFIPPVSGG
jgi:molybdopterin converting factor small subunit